MIIKSIIHFNGKLVAEKKKQENKCENAIQLLKKVSNTSTKTLYQKRFLKLINVHFKKSEISKSSHFSLLKFEEWHSNNYIIYF